MSLMLAGDNISVTNGVVSRVEPQPYAHSEPPSPLWLSIYVRTGATHLLAVQIDAAINPSHLSRLT